MAVQTRNTYISGTARQHQNSNYRYSMQMHLVCIVTKDLQYFQITFFELIHLVNYAVYLVKSYHIYATM